MNYFIFVYFSFFSRLNVRATVGNISGLLSLPHKSDTASHSAHLTSLTPSHTGMAGAPTADMRQSQAVHPFCREQQYRSPFPEGILKGAHVLIQIQTLCFPLQILFFSTWWLGDVHESSPVISVRVLGSWETWWSMEVFHWCLHFSKIYLFTYLF